MTNPKPDVNALAGLIVADVKKLIAEGFAPETVFTAVVRRITTALSEQEGEIDYHKGLAQTAMKLVGERAKENEQLKTRMACGHSLGDWEPELTVGQGPHCRSCKQQAEVVAQATREAIDALKWCSNHLDQLAEREYPNIESKLREFNSSKNAKQVIAELERAVKGAGR